MNARILLPAVALLAVAASAAFLLSGPLTSRAVQNPTFGLDMVTAGNSYSDPGLGGDNSMSVGAIDNCLTSPTANPLNHTHLTQLIVQNVEDLVAFQVRLNYIGDKMRPSVWNPTPFSDTLNGGNVGFINLPMPEGFHRVVTPTAAIPAAPPDNSNTPQTALVGGAFQGLQTFAVSPDTPAKATPDDTSYSAPNGGVLGQLNLMVVGNESGNQLFMNLDDANPNTPGSRAVVFNGTGTDDINLTQSQMTDGFHGEGVTCIPRDCTTQECPSGPLANYPFTNQTTQAASDLHITFSGPFTQATLNQNAPGCPAPTFVAPPGGTTIDVDWGVPCVDNGESVVIEVQSEPPASPQSFFWTISGSPIPTSTASPSPAPTPTASPFPVAGHDARLVRISGVPKTVRLLPGEVVADTTNVVVANESDHTELIGVYIDVQGPVAGGCVPNERMLETTTTLSAGAKATFSVSVSYSCSNPAAANGFSYTWVAAADHGADDLSACGPGALQGLACYNALANDDQTPADNRASRNGPKVVAQ